MTYFDTQTPVDGFVMERQARAGGYKVMSLSIATGFGFAEVDITSKDTTLWFIWKGTQHRRVIDRSYKRAFAVTLAKRFVLKIVDM